MQQELEQEGSERSPGDFWNLSRSLSYPLPAALTCLPYAMHQQPDVPVHLAHRTSSICTAAGSQVEGRTRTLWENSGQGPLPGARPEGARASGSGGIRAEASSEEMGSWLRDRARDGGRASPSHGRSLQVVSRSLGKSGKVSGHTSSCATHDPRFTPSSQGPHTEDNTQPSLLAPDKQTCSSGSPRRRH